MFSHIHTGVSDFERAFAFYSVVLKELGLVLRFREDDEVANIHWAGWQTPDVARPLFLIGKPFDKAAHQVGNGQMVAFLAVSRAQVRRVYETALANGGTCEGAPGLRPHYHANYYGAYFRDTEGNKVGVVCHEAEWTKTIEKTTMTIELSKEDRAQAIASIERYFRENMEEKIGNVAAGGLLGFFIDEIGPSIYNKAVADIQERLQQRIADLDFEVNEDEFTYWRKYDKARK